MWLRLGRPHLLLGRGFLGGYFVGEPPMIASDYTCRVYEDPADVLKHIHEVGGRP